jgi:hypothetical protein
MRMFLLLIPIALSGATCGKREVKSGTVDPFPANFNDIRSRILMPRCVRCHGLVESQQMLVEKWVVPGDAHGSALFRAIDSGSMPPYGHKLVDEEIEAVRLWIDAGALP